MYNYKGGRSGLGPFPSKTNKFSLGMKVYVDMVIINPPELALRVIRNLSGSIQGIGSLLGALGFNVQVWMQQKFMQIYQTHCNQKIVRHAVKKSRDL